MEQQGLADARRFGDFTHRTVLVGVPGENPVTRVEDGLLLFSGQGKELFIHEGTSVDRSGQ